MTREQLEYQRTLAIKVCLQGHLYCVQLGEQFGPEFTEHGPLNFAVSELIQEQDPKTIARFVDSCALNTMLNVVQEQEELVLASLGEQYSDLDTIQIRELFSDFTEQLLSYWQCAYGSLALTDGLTPAEEIQAELDRRGLTGKVVVALTKRGLRERIHDRKVRHKWLRTVEGRKHLRDLALRRRRHHRIDPQKSKTARLASKLYQDER